MKIFSSRLSGGLHCTVCCMYMYEFMWIAVTFHIFCARAAVSNWNCLHGLMPICCHPQQVISARGKKANNYRAPHSRLGSHMNCSLSKGSHRTDIYISSFLTAMSESAPNITAIIDATKKMPYTWQWDQSSFQERGQGGLQLLRSSNGLLPRPCCRRFLRASQFLLWAPCRAHSAVEQVSDEVWRGKMAEYQKGHCEPWSNRAAPSYSLHHKKDAQLASPQSCAWIPWRCQPW